MLNLLEMMFPNMFGFSFGGSKGGGSSAPAPQPVAQVPSPPTYGQSVKDYVENYPQLYDLQQKYAPLEARQQMDLLNQFGPELTKYYTDEQQRLTPYTYGLQEQLAKLASENSNATIPDSLRNAYTDQYRAEIGQNAGSPIGADYVGNNLARTGEDYRRYYQGLGLSLLNKVPAQAYSPANPQIHDTSGGLNGALGYNQGNYGNYVGGIASIPYTNGMYQGQGSGSGMNFGGILSSLGQFGGAAFGAYQNSRRGN